MKIDGSPFLPPEYDSICIDWSKKCIEIDNYYQKTFAQFQKEALDLAKQNSSGDFEVYYIRFTPDNGFWKSSLRKESSCSVLAMQDQLTRG